MKQLIVFTLLLQLLSSCQPQKNRADFFSFHLFQEPLHLDPAKSRASSASYFFYNTLRGIYRIDKNNRLKPEGGQCQWLSNLSLSCQLNKNFWSNGDPVTTDDYIRSFTHLITPETASPRANLLTSVKNGLEILQGKVKATELGITKMSELAFKIHFQKRDPEFLYKLASTALYPTHKDHKYHIKNFNSFIVNGPYQIKSWVPGKEMILKPNSYYKKGHKQRPQVQILFIDDEMTAFRLFQRNKLSFLRRIPSNLIEKLKDSPEFFQRPMLRFDYLGFGEELMKNLNLRKALTHSIDYGKLKILLGALEQPGCPSIPKEWLNKQTCYDFNLEKAKSELNKIGKLAKKQVYKLKVSQQGGNDIKKQAEFFQHQWRQHLGLNVEVTQVEQKVFLNELRATPPDIFRKGVGLDRPTCRTALETFASDSKQNFILLKDPQYENIIEQMTSTKDSLPYKKLCQQGVEFLMDQHFLIPLGEMHFSFMAHSTFTGWSLNGMNQLDLSQVRPVEKPNFK